MSCKHLQKPLLDNSDVIAGTWTIHSILGQGSEAHIYKGGDNFGNVFAVKIEKHPGSGNLRREYEIYKSMHASLGSNEFPQALYCGVHGKHAVMVMDLLGKPLFDLLSGPSPPDASTMLHWARQILKQLQTLHNLGFVHGDVHFQNIIAGRFGTSAAGSVILIDFGMACRYLDGHGLHVASNAMSRISRRTDLMAALNGFSAYVERIERSKQSDSHMITLFSSFASPFPKFEFARKDNSKFTILGKFKRATQHVEKLDSDSDPDYALLFSILE